MALINCNWSKAPSKAASDNGLMVLITAQQGVARPDWGRREVRTITPGPHPHLGKLGWRHVLPMISSDDFHSMMTSSNGNIFRVTGPLCGEFTCHRWIPLTKASDIRSFDAFFDLRLNKRLSKQSRRRWFETPSRSLWHHCYAHFQRD